MASYVYFVKAGNAVKIGVANNIIKRMKSIQTHNSMKVKFCYAIKCKSRHQALALEGRIHHWQKKHRIRGEWFNPKCIDGFKGNISHLSGSESKLITNLDDIS